MTEIFGEYVPALQEWNSLFKQVNAYAIKYLAYVRNCQTAARNEEYTATSKVLNLIWQQEFINMASFQEVIHLRLL